MALFCTWSGQGKEYQSGQKENGLRIPIHRNNMIWYHGGGIRGTFIVTCILIGRRHRGRRGFHCSHDRHFMTQEISGDCMSFDIDMAITFEDQVTLPPTIDSPSNGMKPSRVDCACNVLSHSYQCRYTQRWWYDVKCVAERSSSGTCSLHILLS